MTISQKSTTSANISWRKILLPIAIALVALFCLAPVLWQVLTSFKTNEDIAAVPTKYFPSQYTLNHYINLFTRRPFWRYILNSAFVSIVSTVVSLAIGAPAAYALARLRPWGGNVILAGVLIVTLFPGILLFFGLLEVVQVLHLG